MLKITEFKKLHLRSGSDESGEWSTSFHFDLMLSDPCEFTIYGETYKIDRISLYPGWSDEITLVYANETDRFENIEPPKNVIVMVRDALKAEEHPGGKLKGYSFSGCLMEEWEEYFPCDDDEEDEEE